MTSWYASKTVWFNVVMTIVGISTALGGTFPQYGLILGALTTVGNVILRVWFTSTPIGSTS